MTRTEWLVRVSPEETEAFLLPTFQLEITYSILKKAKKKVDFKFKTNLWHMFL